MSAHTPGPWHCKNADGKWASAMGWRVDHDDFRGGSWLPVRAGKKVLALAFCGDGPNSVRAEAELDANTCLIARAPDLLAENTRLTARVAKLEAALRWSYANRRAYDVQELMARAYNAEPQTPRTRADVVRHTMDLNAWDRIAEANQDGEETWRAEVRAVIAARAALTPEPK